MKSKLTTLLLCLFLGVFGAHRFYVRKFGTGILYLCTGGLFGVGFFVDLFSIIFNKFTDKDGNTLNNDITSVNCCLLLFLFLILIASFASASKSEKNNINNIDTNIVVEDNNDIIEDTKDNIVVEDTKDNIVENEDIKNKTLENTNNDVNVNTDVKNVEIEYIPITVKQLYDELHNNALRAERTYQDSYIVINGKLKTIDSDGEYISITDSNDSWNFDDLLCDIKNEKQIDKIMELNVGDDITIYCKIVSIGEILGYKADIINIQ